MFADLTVVLPISQFSQTEMDAHRAANLGACLRFWRGLGLQVSLGVDNAGEGWSKGRAMAVGVAAVRTPYMVMADADVVVHRTALVQAFSTLRSGHRWVIPHTVVDRWTAEGTASWRREPGPLERVPVSYRHRGMPGGGMVLLHTVSYLEVPMDPRFVGWGQEDESWAMALMVLLGRPVRLGHTLHHLWHPRPEKSADGRWGSPANRALYERYQDAKRQRKLDGGHTMRALLDEFKAEAEATVGQD